MKAQKLLTEDILYYELHNIYLNFVNNNMLHDKVSENV